MPINLPDGTVLEPGSAAYYRKRFESSVMGQHMMMPPKDVSENMLHPEAPPTHPCGPNTNFQYPTPMPFTFQDGALSTHNSSKHGLQKMEHPIYVTSTSEIGKLSLQHTDLHMRWYGLKGDFTSGWDSAPSKTRVNTGLNTAMDRSDFHPTFDQGWSGHLGLTDFNIANGAYAKQVVRPSRKPPKGM